MAARCTTAARRRTASSRTRARSRRCYPRELLERVVEIARRPNLLLLDGPTNHLDLETREALTTALAQFEGTLMLVSHDRHLLRATTDEFIIVADGAVSPFDGDLDDYKDWLYKTKLAAKAA
ncbi:hypothetical protein G6F31_019811 [Rhizopus arrhizus]|nr:hypothetical protein G6F31_019811 [Rhizopus arrhizus]